MTRRCPQRHRAVLQEERLPLAKESFSFKLTSLLLSTFCASHQLLLAVMLMS